MERWSDGVMERSGTEGSRSETKANGRSEAKSTGEDGQPDRWLAVRNLFGLRN